MLKNVFNVFRHVLLARKPYLFFVVYVMMMRLSYIFLYRIE
jgi:hypothetical protein